MLNIASKISHIIRDLIYNMLAHFSLVLTEEGSAMQRWVVWGFFLCINSNLSDQLEKLDSVMIFQFSFKQTFFPRLRNIVSIHEDRSTMLGVFLRLHNLSLSQKSYDLSVLFI